jgi:hypothetical protein
VRLGLGIASGVSSPAGGIFPTDEIFLRITGKQKLTISKQSDIIRGRQVLRNYSQAKFKASYDYNVRTEKWTGKASASLSHAMFRFAEDQDVRITAGYQTSINSYGLTEPKPFVRIEENCWQFESDFNGSWHVRYAL